MAPFAPAAVDVRSRRAAARAPPRPDACRCAPAARRIEACAQRPVAGACRRGSPPTSNRPPPRRKRALQRVQPSAIPGLAGVAARGRDRRCDTRAPRVVIVSGETGSGKTTQLPKICLAAGRGLRGLIGHTQPRRIAARAVATASRRSSAPLGEAVGFKVRFTDHAARRVRQAHDRRHPARRDAARPLAHRLRHVHRRRGARAQPQHRLPARVFRNSPLAAGSCASSSRRPRWTARRFARTSVRRRRPRR